MSARSKACAAAVAVLLSMPGAAHAECLTKEERKAANERYNHCKTQADASLDTAIQAWEIAGCNKIPQPMNCHPPYPQWEKDKKECLEEFKAGVTE